MWKDYSVSYIKNNRSSSVSVLAAAFISALLLSLLCGEFYNLWNYEIERIEQEEGGWQSRIAGDFQDGVPESITNFATVKDALINERESSEQETVIDLYFHSMKDALTDTPQIAELAGASPEAITYHYNLLAMYFIRDPSDPAPRLTFPLLLFIGAMASFSLIMIIHNSFAMSMNTRIHQFGIFSSIGATPKQIRTCLLQEAAALCAIPILAGNFFGIGLSFAITYLTNVLGKDIPGRHEAVFTYHPVVFLTALIITIITIWISAWLPARKLSKLTPLEAVKTAGGLQLKRKKNSPLLTLLFGAEGELAGNALKAQRKALRAASLSLIFSFLAFTMMQCFFTLSGISTRETYFVRYMNVWDIMATVKNEEIDSFEETRQIQELSGIESAVVYQKAVAKRVITDEEMTDDMRSFGGFDHASPNYVARTDEGWMVNVPIIILDDNSFLAYCEQIGIDPQLHGAIILNQIRDVTNPDFRHPVYMPYINETGDTSILRQAGKEEITAEIPVLAYTSQVPVLREEYATLDFYELVHFLPVSLWKEIKGQIGGTDKDLYIRVRGMGNVTLEELNQLEDEMDLLLGQTYEMVMENRIQEKELNDKQIQGMMTVFGSFCVLLAIIGISNVFSNTLAFVRQRKREFAQYLSVGLTPEGIRKMFCIEALVIAGRPVLITLPLAVLAMGAMLRASYLEVGLFLSEAPLLPIAAFMLAIWVFVALAYYLGWRNVQKISLVEVLRDDTMM
ncbi:ABC transporter permease [Candidatus Merdisoma sp. JLR.KK006]|uniref:ABC transporter permease n=1 Tax=Candidatus Merdisoma sp. JLR.KK006 TaxID=3112626 RepID=UPI002FF1DCA2